MALFKDDLLPEALRSWVMDVADRMQCPPDYPAVGAMVCLASVVGRQCGIRPKVHDDWLAVPNLYGAVVGRPAMLKSPALAEPMNMLHRLQKAGYKKHEEAMLEFEAKKLIGKESKKQKTLSFLEIAKAGGDALAAAKDVVRREREEPEPSCRRYLTNDSTVEKIGELLRDNPVGLLVFRDELTGWLRSLDKFGQEGARAFYLEAWNGNSGFTFDRIGRGTIEIEAACLSVLGGIQPGPLNDYLSAALSGGAGDDGLLQRMQLLVWPDAPANWRNVDRSRNADARDAAWRAFSTLDNLDTASLGATQEEGDSVPWLRFSPDAQREFDRWRGDLEHRLRAGDLPPALESHLAKYRSLVPSLALLCHLVDHPEGGPVGLESLRRGLAWAEYLETHAQRLYAQALNPEMAAAVELDKHLRDLPEPFTAKDVYKNHWQGLDSKSTDLALKVLCDFGRIRGQKTAGRGRPTTNYWKNPKQSQR